VSSAYQVLLSREDFSFISLLGSQKTGEEEISLPMVKLKLVLFLSCSGFVDVLYSL